MKEVRFEKDKSLPGSTKLRAKGKTASPVAQPIVIDAKIRTESFSIIFILLYLFANTPYHW